MRSIKKFFERIKPENIIALTTGAIIAFLMMFSVVLTGLEKVGGMASDFTTSDLYTLSDESLELIADLEKEIKIYTLYSPGNENPHVSSLLNSYASKSSKIKLCNVDPSGSRQELSFVEGVSSLAVGSVIVTLEDESRYTVLSAGTLYITDRQTSETFFRAESKLTSAIYYVITGDTVNIKLLYGHQETAESDIAELKTYLDSLNYNVSRYDYLRSSESLDVETDILVAVSPKTDLTQEEYKGISDFLKDGGTFVVLMDNSQYNEATGMIEKVERVRDRFELLLRDYGMTVNHDLLVSADISQSGFRSTTLVTAAKSPLMRRVMAAQGNAVLSECSSIAYDDGEASITPLLVTGDKCYSTPLEFGVRLGKKDSSKTGAFTVGAMSKKDKGTLILFTTSSFIRSAEFAISANSDAFLDALSLAAVSVDDTEVQPKLINKGFSIKSGFMRAVWIIILGAGVPLAALVPGIRRVMKRRRITLHFKK